nr:hypothetical protein [Tanacetum cinerariifolium]
MHNNIMAAGSRDRPPMLAPGRYPQWRSQFLRYVDTRPNCEALRKCILSGPYKQTTVLVHTVEATDNSPAVPKYTTVETPTNMSPKNKAHFLAEKEAIHLILIGIRDDIYSTVDACQTTQEMWEPKWSRFVTIVKQQHKLDEVSYHKLFDIVKHYQNEVNELRPGKLARNANPLALVATAQASQDQFYQTSRSHRSSAPSPKPSIPFRSHTTTRHKGKEIAKLITPPSEIASKEDSDHEQAQRDKDMQNYMAKIQEVSIADSCTYSEPVEQTQKQSKKANTTLAQELKECKAILAKTSKYLGEFISVRDSCLVALQTKQAEFEKFKAFNDRTVDYDKLERKLNEALGQLAHKDTVIREGLKTKAYELSVVKEKPDELMKQSLLTKSHYEGLVKQKTKAQSEILCLYAFPYDLNTHANRLIPDEEETLALERESQSKLNKDSVNPYDYTKLNSLYEIFKPPTQEYETQLAHANEISKSRQAYNIMTNKINHFKQTIDDAWTKHSKDLFFAPTAHDMEILIQTCLIPLAIKTQGDSLKFVNELKQEMHADLKYVESLDKEIDKLESEKAEFSDMYDEILQDYALDELQRLYLHKLSNQTESVSKEVHSELLKRFAKVEKHSNSLEIALQKRKEQVKNDTVWNEKASNVFRKEHEQYIEIQDLKAQLQDKNIAISGLKKLIKKGKGKSMDTKFDRPSVVRQPNAQRIPKQLVLGKPAPFSNSLARIYFPKTKSVPKTNVSEGFSKPVTAQTLPQTTRQAVNIDTICNERASNVFQKEREQYFEIQDLKAQLQDKNISISELKKLIERGKGKFMDTKFDRPSVIRQPNAQQIPKPSVLGVIHKPNVSRPQLKRNQLKDKVLLNNSQVKAKKTQVEVHPMIPSVSNKMNSVTACKDNLNSRTLNANAVCATFNKCLVDSNHFACVTKMLNDVHARTKKPTVVSISTRNPKSQANKSIATPPKIKVASKSTNQKQQSYFRIVQLILFIIDFGYTKHMTGNLKLLCNFVEKFLGTVRFGDDQFAPILGYGDLVQGNVTINRVAFRKSTCFVRDLQGNDLLIGNRGFDLYIISLQESTSSTPLCLMAKSTPTQAWLWHRRLSHLNFDYINLLSKKDIMIGLPKLKYVKDQLCSSCELSKAKRSLFKLKAVPSSKGRLNLLHIDLCGPMRVASINGKKYILVIVDDYSRYTWTLFLRSKDETPKVLKYFLMM